MKATAMNTAILEKMSLNAPNVRKSTVTAVQMGLPLYT